MQTIPVLKMHVKLLEFKKIKGPPYKKKKKVKNKGTQACMKQTLLQKNMVTKTRRSEWE